VDDPAGSVLGGDPHHEPADIIQRFHSADVGVELPPASVVIAVVLRSDTNVLPTHVQQRDRLTESVVDRNLGPWPRKAGTNPAVTGVESIAATARSTGYRQARSSAVRAGVVARIPAMSPTSSSPMRSE
jgi:hypothetical protein